MCDWCLPIFGKRATPHKPSECCVKQSTFCVVCGPNTHFDSCCPKRNFAAKEAEHVIPCELPSRKPKRPFFMQGTNEGFIEFLKAHNQPHDKNIQVNRLRVEAILTARGCILTLPLEGNNPCMTPLNPPEKKLRVKLVRKQGSP
jgi:hypothetical protein